eukprot:446995-Amphidinium_carterae.1
MQLDSSRVRESASEKTERHEVIEPDSSRVRESASDKTERREVIEPDGSRARGPAMTTSNAECSLSLRRAHAEEGCGIS